MTCVPCTSQTKGEYESYKWQPKFMCLCTFFPIQYTQVSWCYVRHIFMRKVWWLNGRQLITDWYWRQVNRFGNNKNNTTLVEKYCIYQGKNYTGAPGDFAPEMRKRALKNILNRDPENCHRLQCKSLFNVGDLVSGMWKVAPENKYLIFGLVSICRHENWYRTSTGVRSHC